MSVVIRDVLEHELDSIVAINNAAGPTILPLDAARVRWFYDSASYFRVAEVDGHLAGFLLGLDRNTDYTSTNYLWFRERYEEFLYIDRIVIARPYRGLGLGRIFYADVTSFAEVRVPLLACEVFLEPHDDVSLLFHATNGFQEVGQQVMPVIERRVSMQGKNLPSFPFVRDTYLNAGERRLPDVPWLADRAHALAEPPRAAGGV